MITPAGWYPQPDGQQRYWDGQKWTGHRAHGIAVVSLPAKDYRAWLGRHKVIVAAGSVLSLVVFFGAAGGGSGTEAAAASTVATVGPVATSGAPRGSAGAEAHQTEQAFVKASATGGIDYVATTKALDRHLIKRTRPGTMQSGARSGCPRMAWHAHQSDDIRHPQQR